MKLTNEGIQNAKEWESKGYKLPKFDREKMIQNTLEKPFWIHFGAGNIFRAFQANVVQNLLNEGKLDRGIIVAEGFDYEIIEKMNRPSDDLSVLVTLKADGNVEKTVVGSIAKSYVLDTNRADEFDGLKKVFANPSLQMVTFTITEKGYSLKNAKGEFAPLVAGDFTTDPYKAQSYIGKVAALLYHRYESGKAPIAMVSMDNCSHNGVKLYDAIHTFAKTWVDNKICDAGFLAYVEDDKKVSFPWTMIDKITPRPDDSIVAMLKEDGFEHPEAIVTSKNTYVAPFVNSEECEYLVIEDKFPNGREALEKGGFIFTEQETVDKVERMKVCTCLNPLHTSLAVYGCLLGYTKISEEMKDPELLKMVQTIGYKEGLPVVTDPIVIRPKDFIDTVVNVRIPNPFMPDTPQRIATDTSQKLPIRFGETIKRYIADPSLKVTDLKLIPLVYAGWIRYLMGVDDNGNTFERSSDPLLESLDEIVAKLSLGKPETSKAAEPFMHRDDIFGVDLEKAGLSEMVLSYLEELLAGPGAVRATLKKYV